MASRRTAFDCAVQESDVGEQAGRRTASQKPATAASSGAGVAWRRMAAAAVALVVNEKVHENVDNDALALNRWSYSSPR